ncbi:uncharacterized protein LOC110448819 [Mizuhopecten yessoensis]|uniref:Uncharacterized protein n=1 Tax=Mizuhopecten yessoensis TaxID=6573 RepID=A0A210QSE6_MIZYE|nr:uncharacterized protein LOC110448819 [Mizuhopecten yessoensis]OWF51649.1 hypothetical protein KP79_PYT11712 [Mizuhopecten yessoensis]
MAMSVSLSLLGVLATLIAVSCHDPLPVTCKFPEVKEIDPGYEKVTNKEGIKLSKRQKKIEIPAANPKKYRGEIWEGTRASQSCGGWLSPHIVSPFLHLCNERRTFTQTGNYVIYQSRFCLVSRPFNSFKYPSVECINKECKNVWIRPGEAYRCVPGGSRVYGVPVYCINKGKPTWYTMPLKVNTCCVCRHFVCPKLLHHV